jgi:CBS domain-containing protein
MSLNVVTIAETASCLRAVETICAHKIRHLPVVDARGRLVGVVTDRDLRHYLFRPEVSREIGGVPVARLLERVPVGEIMSAPVVVVAPDEPLETAARLMLEDKVGSVPVVEDGRVVGILTETDLLRRIVGEDAGSADVECIVVSYP